MECCTRSESPRECRNPLNIEPVSAAWLINTKRDCLVEGADPEAQADGYIALRYTWRAQQNHFQARREYLSEMKQPGSLSPDSGSIGARIAPTIRHAMGLVKLLGDLGISKSTYLWVSAISIMQDDPELYAGQLPKMGRIYASAELIIVASDGVAADGILGLPGGVSPPRQLRQRSVSFLNGRSLVVRQSFSSEVQGLPYSSRGWTFQEFGLSWRCLTFWKGQMHWMCSCIIAQDDATDLDEPRANVMGARTGDVLREWQGFANLDQYNVRDLKYDSDALPAVAAFLEIAGQFFDGGFHFGLPEMRFDAALMWRSRSYHPQLERRMPWPDKRGSTMVPSWSWFGWKGPVQMLTGEEDFQIQRAGAVDADIDTVDASKSCRTTPITQWYKHATPFPNSADKRVILCKWSAFAADPMGRRDRTETEPNHGGWRILTPDDPLRPGRWTDPLARTRDIAGYNWSGTLSTRLFYKHDAFSALYWCPIPVLNKP